MQLPSEVNDVMNRYMESFKCYFPNELEGVYLHGSIALGAYTHGLSDIDFITVTKHRFTSSEIKKVSELHKEIKAVFRETELDGVYMTKERPRLDGTLISIQSPGGYLKSKESVYMGKRLLYFQ